MPYIFMVFLFLLILAPIQILKADQLSDGFPHQTIDVSQVPDPIPVPLPYSSTGNPPYYDVNGHRFYVLKSNKNYDVEGFASWYGTKFHGKRTSSGEPYNMFAMTAASPNLPIPCFVKVTNLENGKQVIVKVNDRGPFHEGRVMDLSYTAAKKLGVLNHGTALVRIVAITFPQQNGKGPTVQQIYLQIASFHQADNATNLAKVLRSRLKQPVLVNLSQHHHQPIYRVMVGPFPSTHDSQQAQQQLNTAGIGPTVAVQLS